MVRGMCAKGVVFVLLLCAPALAVAVPTRHDHERVLGVYGLSASPGASAYYNPEIDGTIGLSCPGLARVGTEFHNSDVSSAALPASAQDVRLLPVMPNALLMTLTGVICVSLVKDRSAWRAGLAGLVWAGQAGFAALPQWVSHLAGKKQTEQASSSAAGTAHLGKPEHSYRLRSYIEGTRYIGLLRHLAGIPACSAPLLSPASALSSGAERGFRTEGHRRMWARSVVGDRLSAVCVRIKEMSTADQLAVMRPWSRVIRATDCLVARTGQHVGFSPAFVSADSGGGPSNRGCVGHLLGTEGQFARPFKLQADVMFFGSLLSLENCTEG